MTSKSISILREHYLELCQVEKTARREYDAAFKGDNRALESAKRDAWLMARAKRQGCYDLIVTIGLYNTMFSVEDHHHGK